MKKYKCDICHQTMEKESILEGVERLLQELINENINDICLECGSKIIESIYDKINSIRVGDDKINEFNLDSYFFSPLKKETKFKNGDWNISNTTENKKKRIRRKYTTEETIKFKERLFELVTLGEGTKSSILDILDKEFPNRLRTSNAIRLKEIIDKIERRKDKQNR